MKCLKQFFDEKETRVEVPDSRDNPDLTTRPLEKRKYKVGILIGHNKRAQGAYTYPMRDPKTGEIRKISEFEFNKPRGREAISVLKSKYDIDDVCLIFRPPGLSYSKQVESVVEQCLELGVEILISLHVNAASPSARGCEVLVPKSPSLIDDKIGDLITNLIEKRFDIIQRHGNGVKTIPESHAGAGMLYSLMEAGIHAVIVEPVFGNHRSPESERFFASPEKYSDILADVIAKIVKDEL